MLTVGAAIYGGSHRYDPTAIFTFERHPDLPFRNYAAGRLGIVQPTYARSYLYVAYRWLNGAGMTPEEVEQVDRYWTRRLNDAAAPPEQTSQAPQSYDQIRGSLELPWQAPETPNSAAAAQFLAVDYVYYSKCSDDAFATAAETLQLRIGAFGVRSREVAEWVRGQDYVFENCFGAGSGFIPPPVEPGLNPIIRADRDYQIAAALFYSSRYEEAITAFRRIAADAASPWAGWGRYLAGRALLWDARTHPEQSAEYRRKLEAAAAELKLATSGDGPQEPKNAARWLLGRILLRINPKEAAAQLSRRLLSPLGASTREAELQLFTQLMDNLAGTPSQLAEVRAANELVDWIFTFQDEGEGALEHAVSRWRASGSMAWLIAALSKIYAEHPVANGLFEAAANAEGHPGAPTVAYHRARLFAERGDHPLAQAEADKLLTQLRGLDSSRNRALGLRATLARDARELLFFGVRPPAFVSFVYWPDGSYVNPWRLDADGRAELEPLRRGMRWGPETAEILNSAVTVDALIPMVDIDGQSERVRTDLLLAAFIRSVLLERWDLVRALAPRVGAAVPSMKEGMDALLTVTAPNEMRFYAASALLKTPGASLLLRSGPIRPAPLDQPDPRGLNWWTSPPQDAALLQYLAADQQSVVAGEWNQIRATGDGYKWLLEQALTAAERLQPLPGADEALYRAATTLDDVDLQWGYQPMNDFPVHRARAIEALKRRFPDSEWTKLATR